MLDGALQTQLGVKWVARVRLEDVAPDSHRAPCIACGYVAGVWPNQSADLFMGNAGTAIRPLTAVLAAMGGDYTLHGVPRMHERPIGDLVDALNAVGAQIEYTGAARLPAAAHPSAGMIHAQRMSGARQCV